MADRRDYAAELSKLRVGLREIIADGGGPCSFFACPGSDHAIVSMATCNVCYPLIRIRELLDGPMPTVCLVKECVCSPL